MHLQDQPRSINRSIKRRISEWKPSDYKQIYNINKMMDFEDIFNRFHIPGHEHFDSHNVTSLPNLSNTKSSLLCPNISHDHHTGFQYKTQRLILDIYVVSFLCAVGFVGNSLTVAVLRRDRERSNNTTTWLLQTLALVDTFYLITCLLTQTLKAVVEGTSWLPESFQQLFPHVEPYIWPLTATAQTLTVWIVVLVTADRYIAICKPFNPQMRSMAKVRIYVAIIVLAAFIYNIPILFERETHYNFCTQQFEVVMITPKIYYIVYKVICYLIFRSAGPLIVLLVLNYRLTNALKVTNVRRKTLTNSSSKKSRGQKSSKHSEGITRMLIVVVSVFIFCNLPDLTLRSTVILVDESLLNSDTLRLANIITNVLLTLNSSVNFLIYCLVGKKFRRILLTQMCCGVYLAGVGPSGSSTGGEDLKLKGRKLSLRLERGCHGVPKENITQPQTGFTRTTSIGQCDDERSEARV